MLSMDEKLRLDNLEKYKFSYESPDPYFNELAEIAKHVIDVPISGISIVDEHNVWLKARIGVDLKCLDREGAFCSYAIENNTENFIVEDTLKDPLFMKNDLVVNGNIRFYASAVLKNQEGFNIGTLWVMDTKPRVLSSSEKTILNCLASQSINLLESRYLNLTSGLPNKATFTDQLQTLLNEISPAPLISTTTCDSNIIIGAIHIRNLDALENIAGSIGDSSIQQKIAKLLTSLSDKHYRFAHLDNDIFAFSITEIMGASYQRHIDQLENILSKPMNIDSYQATLFSSIGLVEAPFNGVNASSLITQAISAAKDMKGCKKEVVINKCALISHADYIKTLYQDLNNSDGDFGISPAYQPQIDTKNRRIIGFESLARWNNEKIGQISPQDFIPIAENSGLIVDLDLHILKRVLNDLDQWNKKGLELLPIAVNFSRLTISSTNFIEKVQDIISSKKELVEYIKLEVTESLMLDEGDPAKERINQLHDLGFKISIDDFGTGFSNLSSLKLFHFDQLKVDRQFVHGISRSRHISDLFDFIKNVACLFNANLMCEGMENEEDVEVLINLGANHMQGWYFSKAVNTETVLKLLALNASLAQGENLKNYQELATRIQAIVKDTAGKEMANKKTLH